MSIYVDLVCRSCPEMIFLGKQLWESATDRIFGYWHGSAGGGKNWQSDELSFSLFQFLAQHAGHPLAVLDETQISELDPFPQQLFEREPTPSGLIGLAPAPEPAVLVSTGRDRGFGLGRLLTRADKPVLFSRYLECRSSPRAFKALWSLLAWSQTHCESLRVFTADPRWRTATVTALARGIHADRAWDRMCVLGDALQEAGCDDPDVLNHCQAEGHARGCWVVDSIIRI